MKNVIYTELKERVNTWTWISVRSDQNFLYSIKDAPQDILWKDEVYDLYHCSPPGGG